MAIRMRSFHFERPVEEGMPLLAVVSAQGVEFGNGRVVVQWLDEDTPTLMVFESLAAMNASLETHAVHWDEETTYRAAREAP